MVLSKINDKVSYAELKNIDENDKGRDVSMYQIQLFNIPVIIALGDIKFTFINDNILFCPVYLVVDESNKIYQIGVYEFHSKQLENLKDEDGDLDISIIDGPLLYSFIDKAYINKCMKNEKLVMDYDSGDYDSSEDDEGEDNDEEEEELVGLSDEDEDEDEDGEKENGESKNPDELKNPPTVLAELNIEDYEDDDDFLQEGEKEKDDKRERKNYKKPGKTDSQWIESFMTNNNYDIIDNPGKGDCFFYVIRDAFKTINVNADVKKVREKLVERVDNKVFQNYRERYDMYDKELQELMKDIPKNKKLAVKLSKEYNKYAKESKKIKDRKEKLEVVKKAKIIRKKHSAKKLEITRQEGELKAVKKNISEVEWLKNIKTLDQLQKKMKTCDYWADQWAISTLEVILNTKFIILSSDQYRKGNYDGVFQCGDFVHQEIEKKRYFKPKYYIIFEHTGNHYKLISYKEKQIYRFHEIPYGMKTRIVEKCMKSKGKSIYNYIPKFAKLIGDTVDIPIKKKEMEDKKIENEEGEEISEEKQEEQLEEVEMIPTPTREDADLFDPEIEFIFYSRSSNSKPGKGKGESLPEDKKSAYKELGEIKDFRKVLSNFYVKEKVDGVRPPLFELDGKKWASVEHYYHANKFKKNNKDYYDKFALGSGSQWEDDPLKALGAGGKGGNVREKNPETKKSKIIFKRPKEIVMDEDFFDGKNREVVMERGQQAKYEQDEFCKKVLLATKDAKLSHFVPRKPRGQNLVTFYDTMRIRQKLKKKN
tara:strand:+ start:9593 stop:11884 length:2292 start_codon:yes stop_codon:yes gene_type:complete